MCVCTYIYIYINIYIYIYLTPYIATHTFEGNIALQVPILASWLPQYEVPVMKNPSTSGLQPPSQPRCVASNTSHLSGTACSDTHIVCV